MVSDKEIDMALKRIDWIDVAKGITILLVIAAHSTLEETKNVIFSFHMPLFFILSCVTFKLSESREEFLKKTEKAFTHLIVTAAVVFLINSLISGIIYFSKMPSVNMNSINAYLANMIRVFVGASGVPIWVGEAKIPGIGIPWFFFALFGGRTLFDYLHLKLSKKAFYISIVVCTVIGVWLGKIQWLPFSFDIALAIQPFFLFGKWLKSYDLEKKALKVSLISFVVWAALYNLVWLWKHEYLELAPRKYAAYLYPVCIICAIAGTMLVSGFSQIISKLRITAPIKYLGRNSLYLLCIHYLDEQYKSLYKVTSNDYINMLIRIGIDLIVFVLLMLVIKGIKALAAKRKSKKVLTVT